MLNCIDSVCIKTHSPLFQNDNSVKLKHTDIIRQLQLTLYMNEIYLIWLFPVTAVSPLSTDKMFLTTVSLVSAEKTPSTNEDCEMQFKALEKASKWILRSDYLVKLLFVWWRMKFHLQNTACVAKTCTAVTVPKASLTVGSVLKWSMFRVIKRKTTIPTFMLKCITNSLGLWHRQPNWCNWAVSWHTSTCSWWLFKVKMNTWNSKYA